MNQREVKKARKLVATARMYDTDELWDSEDGIAAENKLWDYIADHSTRQAFNTITRINQKATLKERLDNAEAFIKYLSEEE